MLLDFNHVTVLKEELVNALNPSQPGIFIDLTAGGGGHSALLLSMVEPGSQVIMFDQDLEAVEHLKKKFTEEIKEGKAKVIHSNSSKFDEHLKDLGQEHKIMGIMADLGVSSPQIDQGNRGFSFNEDGPLDMRMDKTSKITAYDIVNEYSVEELTRIFYEYGEEPKARFVSKAIETARNKSPINTTGELAKIISGAIHYKKPSRTHPATRAFQAIRIETNKELKSIEEFLPKAVDSLASGGRLAIISFHSLEDRIVKQFMKKAATPDIPKDHRQIPLTQDEISARYPTLGRIIPKFPITPSSQEVVSNPRARSAKLRVFEKI